MPLTLVITPTLGEPSASSRVYPETISLSALVSGQSFFEFAFQISGIGLGSIVGMIILEMFQNAGGVRYNP